ncbi:MAG: hypothetical protein E7321_04935 [Clostridiales bacterium]|nr:hypothetical protein [Clostridiales bacterium]
MKKLVVLVLAFACLFASCACAEEFALRGFDNKEGYQYISMGEFPQDADGSVRPILWRVLSVDESQAYLLSEYVLFNNRVHPDDNEYISFEAAFNQTEMFSLLNGPFEGSPIPKEEQDKLKAKERLGRVHIAEKCFKDQAFTVVEQSMLITDEELGMVFLASADDLKSKEMGFSDSRHRQAYGTEYALANGLFRYQNGTSPYWTRSQSLSYAYATRCTKVDGSLGYIRCVVMNEGCRPAIRLSLDGLSPVGGSGTMEDPYTFAR